MVGVNVVQYPVPQTKPSFSIPSGAGVRGHPLHADIQTGAAWEDVSDEGGGFGDKKPLPLKAVCGRRSRQG